MRQTIKKPTIPVRIVAGNFRGSVGEILSQTEIDAIIHIPGFIVNLPAGWFVPERQ